MIEPGVAIIVNISMLPSVHTGMDILVIHMERFAQIMNIDLFLKVWFNYFLIPW